MPVQGIGDGLISEGTVEQEFPQWRVFKVLIAIGLDKLKHDRVDLLA